MSFLLFSRPRLTLGSCDSYNTAQLQILSGDDRLASPPPLQETAVEVAPHAVVPVAREVDPARPGPDRHLHRPTSSGHAASRARFSPYTVPQRSGRSISPLPTPSGFLDRVPAVDEPLVEESVDDEEELDFWGREVRTRTRKKMKRRKKTAWSSLGIGNHIQALDACECWLGQGMHVCLPPIWPVSISCHRGGASEPSCSLYLQESIPLSCQATNVCR